MITPQLVIRKKRDRQVLSEFEISSFIQKYVSGEIADYQMSALAMAIFLNGFNPQETTCLLKAMIHSGRKFNWSKMRPDRIFSDKHSTGGVGDKTSFIVLPLLIADGIDVPMVAGRGLGHTGGTLDKLESLPGLKTQVPIDTFEKWVECNHGAFGAQTEDFVPADRKLYALRDVTATVDSIPLIAASIMSKKIAEDLDTLVLDVKYGNGAFMTDKTKAIELAKTLKAIGEQAGCKVSAALTSMNEPLGRSAGNAVELNEALDVLSGAGPLDTRELSLQLAARAASLAKNEDHEICYHRMKNHLQSGRPLEIFERTLVMQGAHILDVSRQRRDWMNGNSKKYPLTLSGSGKISSINTYSLGMILVRLGAGRMRVSDTIDPTIGFTELKKVGEIVTKDEPVLFCHVNKAEDFERVQEELADCFTLDEDDKSIEQAGLITQWI